MKEIKTQNYISKISGFYPGPVGDSNLPPGVNQGDIDRQFGGLDDDISNRSGESELTINGKTISVNYTYVYDYNEGRASNVKVRSAFDVMSKKEITNPSMFSYIEDAFMDQIEADIEMQEEDEKINRENQNNPFE